MRSQYSGSLSVERKQLSFKLGHPMFVTESQNGCYAKCDESSM